MASGVDDPSTLDAPGSAASAATIAQGSDAEATLQQPPARESQRMLTRWNRGDSIGRFVVLEPLGVGGMGIVLLAHDPQLDRKIAIKVVRPELSGEGTMAARTRLLREAQAMAKLTHPNVIVVYEFGSIEDDVFIAMEFVEGGTLAQWLAREQRPWSERLSMIVKAGRGLAAAHHAGLVHRDFKPDNVLVGHDGRVRVTDFGLVGGIETAMASRPTSDHIEAAEQLTRTGAVMGTPLYMAPEQFEGVAVDARADQFAFCVALYEALCGKRPFAGTSFRELMENVRTGRVERFPDASGVPSRVRDAILRGLASDPDNRFTSMDELLDALEGAVVERRIRFGLPPTAGVAKVRRDASRLATYLRDKHGIQLDPWLAADYRELVNAIVEQRVDVAWLPPLVFAEASTHGVRPLALLRRADTEGYRGGLVVRSDSGIKSIEQLEGRRMAWVDQESASGHLMLRSLIAARVDDVDRFLGPQQFLGSHRSVVEAVLHGMVDCGATFAHLSADGVPYRSGWHQYFGDRAGEIYPIAFSEPIPSDAIGARAGFDESTCNALVTGMRAMLADAEGREVLETVFNHMEALDDPDAAFQRQAARMLLLPR